MDWFEPLQQLVASHLAEDGSWCVNIKAGADGLDRELYVHDLVIAHVRRWGWHLGDEFCWERNGVPKSPTLRFKNQWEPVYQFARGRWKFRPDHVRHPSENVPRPGGPGVGDTSWADDQGSDIWAKRKRGTSEFMSDVQGEPHDVGEFIGPGLAYPGNRLPTFAGSHEATGHTAAFPVGLPDFFVCALTDPGDLVYDPFVGSGSTILAAHKRERVGLGMEISPAYCDVVVMRYRALTGEEARTDSGKVFASTDS